MISKGNSTKNDVSEMIEELYAELMKRRFELIDKKRMKNKDIAEEEGILEALQAEYESIVKTHTLYLKYQKQIGSSGSGNNDMMAEFMKIFQAQKANTGNIVTEIPKQ